jgi:hypothetical protein
LIIFPQRDSSIIFWRFGDRFLRRKSRARWGGNYFLDVQAGKSDPLSLFLKEE